MSGNEVRAETQMVSLEVPEGINTSRILEKWSLEELGGGLPLKRSVDHFYEWFGCSEALLGGMRVPREMGERLLKRGSLLQEQESSMAAEASCLAIHE